MGKTAGIKGKTWPNWALFFVLLLVGLPAAADVIYQDLGTSAPPASLGSWTMTAYSPSAQALIPDSTMVYSIPGGPISDFPTLSDGVEKRTVPATWFSWSHGYTGPVFFRNGDTVTLTLPINTRAFQFYVEPENFGTFNITVTTDSGTTSGSVGINGLSGARGFGFYTDGADSIISIAISAESGAAGFAIGEFAIAHTAAIQFVNLGTDAPPTHLGTYDMLPFSAAAQASIPDYTVVSSIPGSPVPGSILVSPQFQKLTVPSTFNNWSHGYAGPVFYSNGSDTSTLTLPPNTRAFQFWAEPNLYGDLTLTATTDSGITTGPITIHTPGEATGFGFYSEEGDALNTITIQVGGGPAGWGFAMGEFSIAQWPNFVNTGTDEPPENLCAYGLIPFDTAAQEAIPDSTSVTTIPGSPLPGDLTSSESLTKLTVPGSWLTWSHDYTGPVFSCGGISTTLTLPPETGAFLMYVEPNAFGTVNVIVTTETGVSAPATPVSGSAGAMGFGFCSETGEAIKSLTIALPPGSLGFAIGEFSIARRPFTSVFNDECPYARAVLYRPFLNQQTVDAATEGGMDPTSCKSGHQNRSVWYQYTPDLSGILTAKTEGSAYDTVLSAYTGPCDALVPVPDGCNDDYGGDLQSQVTFSADAGTNYLFYVSAYQPYYMGRLNFGLDLVPCVLTNCSATVPSGAMAGTSVGFQGTVTTTPTNCGTASYDWDFGDGTAHGTGPNPSHTYTAPGTYSWNMTASENGGTCSQGGTITICSLNCSASASPTSGLAPLPVSFTSSVAPSNPACSGTAVYDWDFGDGSAHSSAANITHSYTTPGTYAWSLTVTYNGVTCTEAGSITVCGLSCSASASANAGFAPLDVSFTGSGSISGGCGGAVTYDWDFGDGTAHSSLQNPSHTYSSLGTYTWVMTVTSGGRTCTQTGTIYVCTVSCTATASASSGIIPFAVNFTSTATPTYPACSGSTTFDWDFGDDSAHSGQQNPTHTYTVAGTYTWTLTINLGGVTCSRTGTISACGLTCSATASPTSGFAPLSVAFSGNGTVTGPCSSGVSYDWNFGDGSPHAASQTPSHIYTAAGTYTWTMTVSAAGATCSKTGTITVCTLVCSSSVPTAGQTGTPTAFSATAGGGSCVGAVTYQWSFGDGSTGAGQSVQHLYNSPGVYNWTVVATSGGASCTSTGSITIVVPPVVTLIKKAGSPFRIIVTGSNFQSGIKVYINGTEWTSVQYKNTTKIKLTGGKSLKTVVPKGVPTNFTFVNPDGGTATVTGWSY